MSFPNTSLLSQMGPTTSYVSQGALLAAERFSIKWCICNHKFLAVSVFDVQRLGYECSALCNDGTPQFEVERLTGTEFEVFAKYLEIGGESGDGVSVGGFIVYAETAADIYGGAGDIVSLQLVL